VDGLSKNPSSSELGTIKTCWHGEIDLEIVFSWHVVPFPSILANDYPKVAYEIQVNSSCSYERFELRGYFYLQ
jgi:hypothetical protein